MRRFSGNYFCATVASKVSTCKLNGCAYSNVAILSDFADDFVEKESTNREISCDAEASPNN